MRALSRFIRALSRFARVLSRFARALSRFVRALSRFPEHSHEMIEHSHEMIECSRDMIVSKNQCKYIRVYSINCVKECIQSRGCVSFSRNYVTSLQNYVTQGFRKLLNFAIIIIHLLKKQLK